MPDAVGIYMVGGAVRDRLLGLPVQDRDWVVVGATPEAMLAQGFMPVGRDFPVFLHPGTHEEYALARTERKSGPGYRGFTVHAAPDVTLEEDLARRDLTINSIAVPAVLAGDDGAFDLQSAELVDPFHGRRDLQHKVLRHVTDAFREDPVRILRLARFAARFHDFSVAPETMALMRGMVAAGEVDALVPERVWQELARGLMEAKPARMFEVLRDCGALKVLLPEFDALWNVPQLPQHHTADTEAHHLMQVLDMCTQLQAPLAVRFACLTHDLGKSSPPVEASPLPSGHAARSAERLANVCERWRVPTDVRELAEVVMREHGNIHRSDSFDAGALVHLLERCDAFRKPQRFEAALLACECDARGRWGVKDRPYPQRARLRHALATAQAVATDSIAQAAVARGAKGPEIGHAIHAARVAAVAIGNSRGSHIPPA